jgi:hypothetical protein
MVCGQRAQKLSSLTKGLIVVFRICESEPKSVVIIAEKIFLHFEEGEQISEFSFIQVSAAYDFLELGSVFSSEVFDQSVGCSSSSFNRGHIF